MNIINLIKLIITNFKIYEGDNEISIQDFSDGTVGYTFQGYDEIPNEFYEVYSIYVYIEENTISFDISVVGYDTWIWLKYKFVNDTTIDQKIVYDLIFTGAPDKVNLINELIKYFKTIKDAKLILEKDNKYIYEYDKNNLIILNLKVGTLIIMEDNEIAGCIHLPTDLTEKDLIL